MGTPQPFTINIAQDKLDAIRARVEAYHWFPAPEGLPDWQLGMSTPVLKDLQAYWLDTYDWRAEERKLNKYPQFKVEIEGIPIHFLHVVGEIAHAILHVFRGDPHLVRCPSGIEEDERQRWQQQQGKRG